MFRALGRMNLLKNILIVLLAFQYSTLGHGYPPALGQCNFLLGNQTFDYKDLDSVDSIVRNLISKNNWVITDHVSEYTGKRYISANQIAQILNTGHLYRFSFVDERDTPRYIWYGKDDRLDVYKLVLGVSDKLYVISAVMANSDQWQRAD